MGSVATLVAGFTPSELTKNSELALNASTFVLLALKWCYLYFLQLLRINQNVTKIYQF